MKKRLYLALLLTLTTACVLTGCNGCNTETVEETTELTSEEVSEEIISEETDTTESSKEVTEETTEDTSEEVKETVFESYEAVVNYTANLRAGASIESEKVGLIVEGETVTVLEEIDQWSKISYEEKEVYILTQYLDKTETEETESVKEEVEESAESETEVTEETPAYTVTDMEKTMYVQRSVNVRSGPGTGYDKIGALNTNDEVKVTGQADNGWYRIEYKGNEGFVSNNYLGDAKVVVNNTSTPAPNNNGTGNTTTAPETTTPSTPTVDTTNVATKTVNGTTRYAFRTTANGTPIYEGTDWQWPQYILDVINQCCTPNMSDMEKATAIYTWIVSNVSYDTSYVSRTTATTISTRTATCQGYANTYQSLLCAVGISASVEASSEHAWTSFYISNQQYMADTTQRLKPEPFSSFEVYTDGNNIRHLRIHHNDGLDHYWDQYWTKTCPDGILDSL